MSNLKQYDEATEKYHRNLNIKKVPVFCWDFHHEFLNELRSTFSDLHKLKVMATNSKWGTNNWDLKTILNDEVILITDTKLNIVFASQNITKMNGYNEVEVLGKTPKMFQGKETCMTTSNEISKAVQLQQPFEKTVLNYKKNGECYLCMIKGFPIFNRQGVLSHFIAFEKAA